jgi:hypothetical protein
VFCSNRNCSLKNLEWTAGTSDVKVCKSGVYSMEFTIGTNKASQFTVFVNGSPITSTTAGINQGAGQLLLRQTLPLNKDDIVSVRNYTSAIGDVLVSANAGGFEVGTDAVFVLYKISPLPSDLDPCVFVKEILSCKEECYEWNKDECHSKWKKLYNSFRRYLLHRRDLMVNGAQGYGNLLRANWQALQAQEAIIFPLNLNLHNIKHYQGTTELIICSSGLYKFALNTQTNEPAQFALFVNDKPVDSTISGNDTGANQVNALQLIKLKRCDKVKVVNHTSAKNPINLQVNSGGLQVGINSNFVLFKIAQLCD